MKISDVENVLNEQKEGTSAIIEVDEEEEGKWCSLYCSPKEVAAIFGMKMKWREMGIKMPFSRILRALANQGLQNVDWEKAKANPLTIFEGLTS